MIEITCKNCGKTAQKRKGSQFCSTKCKNAYWNKKRGKQADDVPQKKEKSVSNEAKTEKIPPETIKKTIFVDNPEFVRINSQIQELKKGRNSLKTLINKLKRKMETLKNTDKNALTITGAALGGYGGKLFNPQKPNLGLFTGAIIGAIGGKIYDNMVQSQKPQQIQQVLNAINDKTKELKKNQIQINSLNKTLTTVPIKITKQKKEINPDFILYRQRQIKAQKELEIKRKKEQELKQKEEEERQSRIQKLESDTDKKEGNVVQSRILSSSELSKLDFETLDFQGKWLEFIGHPAINFYLVIHGRPGSGKSTFTIQFAAYLSLKFGGVLYVSGEEGFSKTLQQKLSRLDVQCDNLDFADLHSLEDIIEEVPASKYSFLVLDSLNNMKIDADGIQKIRQQFPSAATIAIAQSTKEGKMRGSNEIIHDCDIEISVSEGQATTIKNRYKETGLTYQIF